MLLNASFGGPTRNSQNADLSPAEKVPGSGTTLLFRPPHALDIDTQLRTLLVQMTALQPQGSSCLRHTVMRPIQFGPDGFALESLRPRGQCS